MEYINDKKEEEILSAMYSYFKVIHHYIICSSRNGCTCFPKASLSGLISVFIPTLLSTHIRVSAASSPALSPKVQISTESHQGLRATSQLLFAETKHEDPVQAFRSSHLRCKHIHCVMAFTAGFSLATEINWASFLTCNIMSLSAVPIETKCYLCFWQENSDTSSAC